MPHHKPSDVITRRLALFGRVQGVGFRAFVVRLAKEMGLAGWVRNDANGVEIEVTGLASTIDDFVRRLGEDAPQGAAIEGIHPRTLPLDTERLQALSEGAALQNEKTFFVLESRGGKVATVVPPDFNMCHRCLQEMFDPLSRRWRYPFVHCAQCGPRYSLCKGLPFDRARTSMKAFEKCSRCHGEYQNENDPRFRTETLSCPKCGPRLSLLDADGKPIPGDPIGSAYQLLQAGKVLAIKEQGCFHLFCDAYNKDAVLRLRERKKRFFKPFPILFLNAHSAARYVQLGMGEPGLLALPERPIILLKKRPLADEVFPDVAVGLPWLGVSLPFSALHYLLFHEALGRPEETEWLKPAHEIAWVMTSANSKREPPVYMNEEALEQLSGIADAFLLHNRDIVTLCEDSIARTGPGGLQLVRRSRGYVPRAVKLPQRAQPLLAFGSDTKSTVCFTRENEAFVSAHMGEIASDLACEAFVHVIEHLSHLLNVSPAYVVHDTQENLRTTQMAKTFAKEAGIPALGIAHHHAHVGAVLAEHHYLGEVFALSLDSGALAEDGTLWGGELLRVTDNRFERLSHLSHIGLCGYSKETRTPWQMASAILHALGRTHEITERFLRQPEAEAVFACLMEKQHPLLLSSSMGIIQRSVAALLGITQTALFRDQTLLLLEGAAERFGDTPPLENAWTFEKGTLNVLPLLDLLCDEKDPDRGSALFHSTLTAALIEWVCLHVPAKSTVVICGGSLQNQVMRRQLRRALSDANFRVLEPLHFPPNDGALALGQAWVAQHHF